MIRWNGSGGSWAGVVATVGIEPRSDLMKSIHVGLGGAWLVVLAAYALGAAWAWSGMLVCAVLALWYLPFGTILSLIQIGLLLLPSLRSPEGG